MQDSVKRFPHNISNCHLKCTNIPEHGRFFSSPSLLFLCGNSPWLHLWQPNTVPTCDHNCMRAQSGLPPPRPTAPSLRKPALRNHSNAHTPVIKQGIISALSLLNLCYPSNIVNRGGGRTIIGTYRKSITCKWKCKKAGVWVVCNGSSTSWALLPFRSKRRREWRCRQSVDLNALFKLCGYFCRYCQFLKGRPQDTFIFSNVAS